MELTNTHIVTRKVQIVIDCDDVQKRHELYGELQFIAGECVKMANFIINQQNINFNIKERIILYNDKLRAESFEIESNIAASELEYKQCKDKELRKTIAQKKKALYEKKKEFNSKLIELEKTFYSKSGTTSKVDKAPVQNSTYQLLTKRFPHISSYIRASMNDNIFKNFKADYPDVLRGLKTIRSYKSVPIFFTKSSIINLKYDHDKKAFTFTWLKIPFKIFLGRDESNNKIVIQRIIEKIYALCDSSISQKNNKWFLNLIVKMPIQKKPELSPDVQVGVDLGVEIPIAVTSTNDKWGKFIGNKNLIFAKKKSLQRQKEMLSSSLSYNPGGHGYKKKMEQLNKLNKAEGNYTNTMFHTLAKGVIDYAIAQGAKVIKMEFIEGFDKQDQDKKTLVRYWAPRKLQTLIEQKALQNDISVAYVDPYKTSQTCSCCGSDIEDQRLDRNTFKCKNTSCDKYNKYQNADRNASVNIAKSNKYVTSLSDCTVAKMREKNKLEKIEKNLVE